MLNKILIAITLVLTTCSPLSAEQIKDKIELETKAGVNDYIYGDIAGSNYNRFDDPVAAIGAHYWLNNHYSLGLEYNWSKISVWNAIPKPHLVDSRAGLNTINLLYKYRLFDDSPFNITFTSGIAYLFYELDVKASSDPAYSQPGKYSEQDWAVPLGVTFNYLWRDQYSLNLQAMNYTIFNDRMDAFSNYNPDFSDKFDGYLNLTAGISFFFDVDRDRDKDGVLNKNDLCPTELEDLDGFEDIDGCPDLDNDRDKIFDLADKCPDRAEDFDDFEDTDGCPDLDNDSDTILDKNDRCPNKNEDFDEFQDEDGCPDLDNDKDFVADEFDKCPNQREDYDGFEDTDGCPDPDNDRDGILDYNDNCPNQPETINGCQDDDGCPDKNLQKNDRIILHGILFEPGKSTITAESVPELDKLKPMFANNPKLIIQIEIYTSSENSTANNKKLATERALEIKNHLTNQLQIAKEKVAAIGYGTTFSGKVKPSDKVKVDRVELKILKNE